MARYGTSAIVGLSAAIFLAAPVLAGDNNEALVRQESPFGTSFGNSLTVDQSLAVGAVLGGIGRNLTAKFSPAVASRLNRALNLDTSAVQRGEGNLASVTMSGTASRLELQLLQTTTSPTATGGNNVATMTAVNAAFGGVIQIGEGNTADLAISDGQGLISQLGAQNNAALAVSLGGTASISQIGQLNAAGLEVQGGSATIAQLGNNNNAGNILVSGGGSLSYTQIGNNLTPVQSSALGPSGVQVLTYGNQGTVVISQMAF